MSAPTKQDSESIARARILVVDDDVRIARLVRLSLRSEYECVCVQSAHEAKEAVGASTFDVVVCDLMMPDTSGMVLHRWMSFHHPNLSDRMMFVTGGAYTAEMRKFVASMGDRVVLKPFYPKDLVTRVADLLESTRDDTR